MGQFHFQYLVMSIYITIPLC